MKNLYLILFVLASATAVSCSNVTSKIFNNKSPREKYLHSIEESAEGKQWLQAAQHALAKPQEIRLPFSMKGHFPSDHPRSLGLRFHAKRGELIQFVFNRKISSGVIYPELFADGALEQDALIEADTSSGIFSFEVEQSGTYVLRLQPELFSQGDYDLTISSGPSLGFPVEGSKARIGSFWGAARDGGKRSHEGIDIFASKRTPVIAAADGFITRVTEGGIGGKVVWQRVAGKNLSLYYAHLDEQLVQGGQQVKKGDVIGLVGNTGNARTTPPHLHFGIYTFGGAIDPLTFVKKSEQKVPGIPEREIAGRELRLTRKLKLKDTTFHSNTILVPLAVSSGGYIAQFGDGRFVEAPSSFVKAIESKKSPGLVAGKPAEEG